MEDGEDSDLKLDDDSVMNEEVSSEVNFDEDADTVEETEEAVANEEESKEE